MVRRGEEEGAAFTTLPPAESLPMRGREGEREEKRGKEIERLRHIERVEESERARERERKKEAILVPQ